MLKKRLLISLLILPLVFSVLFAWMITGSESQPIPQAQKTALNEYQIHV